VSETLPPTEAPEPVAPVGQDNLGALRPRLRAVVVAALLALPISGVAFAFGFGAGTSVGSTSDSTGVLAVNAANIWFAQHMGIHHGQAVEASMRILAYGDDALDPEVASLARDIVLTQTNQQGQFRAALSHWSQPASPQDPMPLPVSSETVRQISRGPVEAAQLHFLQVMAIHHRAGVDMAQDALSRGTSSLIRELAEGSIRGQQAELDTIIAIRTRLGDPDPKGLLDPAPQHAGH
jgi:uncharacterized protein (DUF305 family)